MSEAEAERTRGFFGGFAGGFGVFSSDLPPLPDGAGAHPERCWLDVRTWFVDPDRPLEVEIGSGKGTFLAQQAGLQPGTNFLGIEWAAAYFRYAADRVRRHNLDNVRMLHTDAQEFFRWRMPSGVCGVVHLYFPDPWPKARHHKRRTVQGWFMREVWRVLEAGGALRVVTDHAGYWSWMEGVFEGFVGGGEGWSDAARALGSRGGEWFGGFAREAFERAPSAREGEVVGTNFERKYREEGRVFRAAVLRKVVEGG